MPFRAKKIAPDTQDLIEAVWLGVHASGCSRDELTAAAKLLGAGPETIDEMLALRNDLCALTCRALASYVTRNEKAVAKVVSQTSQAPKKKRGRPADQEENPKNIIQKALIAEFIYWRGQNPDRGRADWIRDRARDLARGYNGVDKERKAESTAIIGAIIPNTVRRSKHATEPQIVRGLTNLIDRRRNARLVTQEKSRDPTTDYVNMALWNTMMRTALARGDLSR